MEYHYHLLAEYADGVLEIREQYALLPRDETQMIADRLGIAHPVYSTTRVQRVLTSDLVLTIKRENEISLTVLCCNRLSFESSTRHSSTAYTGGEQAIG